MELSASAPVPAEPPVEPVRRTARGRIVVEGLSLFFGDFVALDRLSLEIAAGSFLCLVGPSGCGKSSILNVIAGFESASEGRVMIDGLPIRGPGLDRGVVFQQPALFPWKTVRANVAHGPRMQGKSRKEAEEIADTLLRTVGLARFADRYPHTLSGGMQQRAAIARALANAPRVLLMDEPFGALDAQTRSMMQEYLLEVWSRIPTTILFITHDIEEAIFLGDRVAVMSASPGTIITEMPVPLPRPRTVDVAMDHEFLRLKRICRDLIRRETMRAFDM